jgi:hypothetical protein
MRTAADVSQDRTDAAHAARVEAGLREVFNNFPDIVVNHANQNLVRLWCNDFSGVHDAVPSPALFRAAVDQNRTEFRQAFVFKPIADQIAGYIDEIIELLRAGGSHSKESLANERVRLSYFTRDKLIQRRDDIRRKQEYNALSVSDLHQKLHGFREAESRMQQNALPPEFTVERLKNNVETLKHCVRRWGVDAVNARLRGES